MPGHRNCAVISCANSGAKLEKWMREICTVHQCKLGQSRCVCPPPFVLYPFPTEVGDMAGRLRWQKLVNRQDQKGNNWTPNRYSRVCSNHFPDKRPTNENPDPVLHLGYDISAKPQSMRKPPMQRINEPLPAKRSRLCGYVLSRDFMKPEPASDEATLPVSSAFPVTGAEIPTTETIPVNNTVHGHDYCYSEDVDSTRCDNEICKQDIYNRNIQIKTLKQCNGILKKEIKTLKQKLSYKERHPFSHTNLQSDSKVKAFTGLPNRKTFDFLFDEVLGENVSKITYWHGPRIHSSKVRRFSRTPKKSGPHRVLKPRDEFLLTLMKLKLGSVNVDLADRFGISVGSVSKIFNTWLDFCQGNLSFSSTILLKKLQFNIYQSNSSHLNTEISDT
ncbi:uncharacterized protein [Ptychodera flava]|uniref:uncharacterized protein n=1 Tax=Ptychodera flava TaxID=63121 RepID=UPI00396A9FE6